MSTNYYAVKKEPSLYNTVIHIGKASIGWLFLFQDNKEFHTYPQFLKWLKNNVDTGKYVLFNEYNEKVEKEDLIKIIQGCQNNKRNQDNPDNFKYSKNIDGYRFTENEFS